jgi:hypothetical protein
MPSEKELLLERIRQLEQMNSALQDKLDMIWSILASDYEEAGSIDGEDDGGEDGLVQIDKPHGKKPQ